MESTPRLAPALCQTSYMSRALLSPSHPWTSMRFAAKHHGRLRAPLRRSCSVLAWGAHCIRRRRNSRFRSRLDSSSKPDHSGRAQPRSATPAAQLPADSALHSRPAPPLRLRTFATPAADRTCVEEKSRAMPALSSAPDKAERLRSLGDRQSPPHRWRKPTLPWVSVPRAPKSVPIGRRRGGRRARRCRGRASSGCGQGHETHFSVPFSHSPHDRTRCRGGVGICRRRSLLRGVGDFARTSGRPILPGRACSPWRILRPGALRAGLVAGHP